MFAPQTPSTVLLAVVPEDGSSIDDQYRLETNKGQFGELAKEHFTAACNALNEGCTLLPRLISGQLRLNGDSEYSQFIEDPSANA